MNRQKSGFSLIELLVVIGIMILLAGLAIPAYRALMISSGDDQTYEMYAAALNHARAIAITESTYTCVHTQVARDSYVSQYPEAADTAYMAILVLDKTKGTDADGDGSPDGQFFLPRKHPTDSQVYKKYYSLEIESFPQGWAIGGLCVPFVTGSGYSDQCGKAPELFTSVTVIFNPDGQVVSRAKVESLPIGPDTKLFGELWEWIPNSSKYGRKGGQSAVTIVNYGEINNMMDDSGQPDVDARTDWLNENAQFLSLNVYTGQIFPREVSASDL